VGINPIRELQVKDRWRRSEVEFVRKNALGRRKTALDAQQEQRTVYRGIFKPPRDRRTMALLRPTSRGGWESEEGAEKTQD